jgi:hypothetical protein
LHTPSHHRARTQAVLSFFSKIHLLRLVRASLAGRRIASELVRSDRRVVAHAPAVRSIRTDASGPTHRSIKFGSPMRRHGQARCPPVSSHVGLGPTWQWLNGRERCWSKAGHAAWPSAAPLRHFALCCGIGSLLHRPTHNEVTSMLAFGPPRRHPMPSSLFKAAAPSQSSTPMLPSPFFPTVVLHTTAGRR